MKATLPLPPSCSASKSVPCSAAATLFVANTGTSLGCGVVPESMLTTVVPCPCADLEMSASALASVAAYTKPLTSPWESRSCSRLCWPLTSLSACTPSQWIVTSWCFEPAHSAPTRTFSQKSNPIALGTTASLIGPPCWPPPPVCSRTLTLHPVVPSIAATESSTHVAVSTFFIAELPCSSRACYPASPPSLRRWYRSHQTASQMITPISTF